MKSSITIYKKEFLPESVPSMRAIATQPRHNITVRLFEPTTAQARSHLKILLLKLDHIGDFITAIDAFRTMRNAFANADITLICLPSVVGLAESTGLFTRVKGFAALPDSAEMGEVTVYGEDRVTQFKELLDGRYFLAADFHHDPLGRFGLDHVDTDCRAAFSALTEKGLDIVIPAMEWDVPQTQAGGGHGKNMPVSATVRMTLLAHAIVDSLLDKPLDVELFQIPKDLIEHKTYRGLQDNKRLKIGISVGAGSELRKWDVDYWAKLLPQLAQNYPAFFVFFGSAGDKEKTQALTAQLEAGSYLDLTDSLPLAHVPAYMNLLDAYIGCDTGLTHLAANLDVPTVNIFAGISNISVWRARGPRVKTVYAEVICSPCHLRFKKDCPNNNICMGAIVPEIVYACFEQLLTPAAAPKAAQTKA